ncbi:MAG: zinc-binding dehydrogenase [Ruminococcus sp.]
MRGNLGGGTIGMFTMQWAKIFGSKKVVVFDISDERLELAISLGADEVSKHHKRGLHGNSYGAYRWIRATAMCLKTAGQVPTMHMAL